MIQWRTLMVASLDKRKAIEKIRDLPSKQEGV